MQCRSGKIKEDTSLTVEFGVLSDQKSVPVVTVTHIFDESCQKGRTMRR
jgi:hypothetical protein